ncbi:PGF-pre-PGF domain-containing protein [Methanolobus psychrotolerans]|uniref:PGF-pre-PGF domain-containing protein n=1 Tax=Methanolobus psychrotolerans TaxID=1874706 RepID=UPI0013EB7F37|nr:PGF-pre-PGF domain-containing protein [Methanolobus psychrotolerans]
MKTFEISVSFNLFLLTVVMVLAMLPVSAVGNVTSDFNVTFSPDFAVSTSRLDRAPEFSVNVSEVSDILWYLDDELLSTYNDVNTSGFVPSLSKTGNYSIKAFISNGNGTVWNQWYWVATSTPSQIISGGSKGGGSSISISSGEDYNNIKVKDVKMQFVNKDAVTKYSFHGGQNPIDLLEFKSSVNAGYVKVTIEVLNNMSSSVSKTPDNTVYCYVYIVPGNTVLENKLSDTRIVFHIDKSWIDESNIDVDSVRLNRFSDSGWKSFPTKVINEINGNVTFVSTTTKFGYFSITGKANENPRDDVIVVDMGGNAGGHLANETFAGSDNGIYAKTGDEDVLSSLLRSMTELFIKRNPVNS